MLSGGFILGPECTRWNESVVSTPDLNGDGIRDEIYESTCVEVERVPQKDLATTVFARLITKEGKKINLGTTAPFQKGQPSYRFSLDRPGIGSGNSPDKQFEVEDKVQTSSGAKTRIAKLSFVVNGQYQMVERGAQLDGGEFNSQVGFSFLTKLSSGHELDVIADKIYKRLANVFINEITEINADKKSRAPKSEETSQMENRIAKRALRELELYGLDDGGKWRVRGRLDHKFGFSLYLAVEKFIAKK
ncbi:MAG: hypothetical protein Q7T03_01745 [Deltaproteobacteria bacterium]|nr:hypothetical protein [Deltaproteobacteria bacterium]